MRFLARCSNFCKPLKKTNSEGCPSNQVSAAAMTSASDEIWLPCSCFLQSREQVVVRRGQFRRIVWAIKTLEAQVGQFLVGCTCPVSRDIVVQEQDPFGNLPAAFLLQNALHLYQQRRVILNAEDPVLIPKNRGENFSSGFLHSGFFGAGWAAMPPLHWLLLCLRVIAI